MSPGEGFIGRPMLRREDERLLRGQGEYVADVELDGMAHATVVRSPYAHARLQAIDLDEARAMPGVLDVFSGRDVVETLRPLPSHRPLAPLFEQLQQLPLTLDVVRYVGEPVAVIVAESRRLAEDAASRIVLRAVQLPVVSALQDVDRTRLFGGRPNVFGVLSKSAGVNLESASLLADIVVAEEFYVQRHSGVPLETRGLVARPDGDGGLTLWGLAKMPHFVRHALAELFHLEDSLVRVRPVDIGGGFGVRGELYPEDFLVPLAALRTGRPVRWIEDRNEHLLGTNHSRESHWRLRAGATRDGELVFIEGRVILDIGAYVRPLLGVLAEQCAINLLGPYRVKSFSCRVDAALTNKMGVGTTRAPGRFEATFAREGILDALAKELGIDPFDLRDRNVLASDDYPYDTGVESFGKHVVYDSGDPRGALRLAEAEVGGDRSRHRSSGEAAAGPLVGVGVVPVLESTGLGPFERARATLEPSGHVTVHLATTSMGQGHATSFAQVAADALGIDVEEVVVVEGDPDSVAAGVGTFASRSLVMGGNAVWQACSALRERLDQLDPDRRLTLPELYERASQRGIVLDVEEEFESFSPTYAYGAHAAVVAVDPSLGTLRILRYVVVADVGRVVNPKIVAGQIQGGVVQGIGGALLEELSYSPEGQPLAASFMDYLLPSSLEAPTVELHLLDHARGANPLGVKGAGEIGTIGVGAAMACAARDALERSGVAVTALPLKPERLAVAPEHRR